MWLGEFSAGDTVDFKFTTRTITGAPTALSGTPAVSVYKGNNTAESTAGVTLTADFDTRTGLNHVRITTSSDGTFYADASDFQVVITTGTVGGTSVVGEVVGHFTLRNRASLKSTTAGRTLDVAATGEAGLDFDNIKQATGATTLTNITVPIASTVSNAVTVGTINANVITATAIAADAITAAKIATGAIDADALASDAVDEIWAKTMTELGAVPGVTASVLSALQWLFLLARNKVTQTATVQTLRNDADNASIATASVSDDGTTMTRAEWS